MQLRPGEVKRHATTGLKIWKEINWELIKGKAGTHEGKTGAYKYYFDPPEVDFATDMVNWCKHANVVQYIGRKWVVNIEVAEGEDLLTFGSAEALQRAVEEDRELQRALWAAMLRAAKLDHVRYK